MKPVLKSFLSTHTHFWTGLRGKGQLYFSTNEGQSKEREGPQTKALIFCKENILKWPWKLRKLQKATRLHLFH